MSRHRPAKVNGDVVELGLQSGLVAIVDVADLELVEGRTWSAMRGHRTWYAYSRPGRQMVRLHRLLMELGPDDPRRVDHRDGDGLNNRRSNLRIASSFENARNIRAQQHTRSRFKGVSRYSPVLPRPWVARIMVDGRRLFLGYFATEEEAAIAYDSASVVHHGEFARTNRMLGLL